MFSDKTVGLGSSDLGSDQSDLTCSSAFDCGYKDYEETSSLSSTRPMCVMDEVPEHPAIQLTPEGNILFWFCL